MTRFPSTSIQHVCANSLRANFAFFGVVISACQCVAAFAAAAPPTFTRDVMPIIQESCQLCHSPERIAPMSFMSYEEVRPWAKAIRKVVANRTMPPFHAETSLGEFENDLRLKSEDIVTIIQWVDGGSPRGNPADAPPIKEWTDAKWELEAPDLVIEYSEFTMSGKVEDDDSYVLFYPNYKFSEDTWVESIEFRGSDYKSVHHAGVFAVDEDFPYPDTGVRIIENPNTRTERKRDARRDPPAINIHLLNQNFLFTWTPGFGVYHLSPGEGILVNKGESIVVQAHLGSSEERRAVSMSLALNFYDGLITKSTHKMPALVYYLEIPPGEPHYELRRKKTLKETIQVYASWTHMHFRGKSNKIIFHYPDGRDELAFSIPEYSFDWQRPYFLKEPVTVPAGTMIEYIGVWDNSSDNPLNPDPSKTVYWGGSTTDEMFGSSLYYSKNLDTPLEVRKGIAVKVE